MTNRIVPQILDRNSAFGKNVYAAVPEDQVIGLVDKVSYIEGTGASPVAVLKAEAAIDVDQDDPRLTAEVRKDLENFVVLRQGHDALLTTKEQLQQILATLG